MVQPSVESAPFGGVPVGEVERFVLRAGDLELAVLTLGATVQSLRVSDAEDRPSEVVLGYADPASYLAGTGFLGAVVGRYANRIAGGRFRLDGQQFAVPPNDGPNALHGGPDGFHRRLWRPRAFTGDGAACLELTLVSPDGDQGFPGRLEAVATYAVSGREVRLDLRATTDAPTVVNLTNHSYFNLAGGGTGSGTVAGHELQIDGSHYLPVDGTLIPLGRPEPVEGTPFDFRAPKPVGADRDGDFDHTWVLDEPGLDRVSARLRDPASGRVLEVLTDAPGLQFYSGTMLEAPHAPGAGLALETQWLPDSPNRPSYPSVVLRPGEEWRTTTVWRFPVE